MRALLLCGELYIVNHLLCNSACYVGAELIPARQFIGYRSEIVLEFNNPSMTSVRFLLLCLLELTDIFSPHYQIIILA